MPQYIVGLFAAFLSPVLLAPANIIDSYFSNGLFKRLSPLIFFSNILVLLFTPALLFFGLPHAIPFALWPVLGILSCVNVFWLYPYYWALRKTDTSIAVSLFSLGNIFVPLLALFIVGERLSPLQYAGFFVIVLSGFALTYERKRVRPNSALFLMAIVSFLLAFAAVLEKYLLVHGVSVVVGITSILPLIALGYALIFEKGHPFFFKENIRLQDLKHKVPYFFVMIIGIILVSGLS